MHVTLRAALLVCVSIGCALAQERPLYLAPTAILTNPDPADFQFFGGRVATNGEYALVLGFRDEYESGTEIFHRAALLYRRVNGRWQFEQVLKRTARGNDSYYYPSHFAMHGNLAVVELDGNTQVYQLDAAGWQAGSIIAGPTEDIEIDGSRIAYSTGDCSWHARVGDPDGAGGWQFTGLSGQPRGCDDEFWGGPLDVSGDRVIVGTPYTFDLEEQAVPLFQKIAGAWYRIGLIASPTGLHGFSGEVVMRGDDAIIDAPNGAYVYHLPDQSRPASRLQSADAYLLSRVDPYRETKLEKSGDLVVVREMSFDGGRQVINVFRADLNAPGTYRHVAVLAPRAGEKFLDSIDVSGNVVIASGDGIAYVYELPATLAAPQARYDNFESGSAAWTTIAGSQFSVVQQGTNHWYRQSSTAGEARALLNGVNWVNQSIEAVIRPTAFDGTDRWVGLVTRYRDAQNYYYVTLRSSGSIQLKRMRNGAFTELARAPLVVNTQSNYRVRLQSIAGTHRVYVNGQLLLNVDDASTRWSGTAGVTMNRAAADFDNVIVSPSPLTTVFAHDFASTNAGDWIHTGSGQWALNAGTYSQNAVGSDARAVIGGRTADQVVQARVRQFSWSTAGTAERWAGVLARYVDDRNYYYLSLRSGGTVSLRKLVNGTIFTLASAPLAVTLNTQYALRLEVVGTQLRAYVNGALLLQTNDSSHTFGVSGLMTNKAAAQFDDYLAYQP
jgi:hypothetical protein